MYRSKCQICKKFLTVDTDEAQKFCSWPCPRTFPLITQSPTWEPIGLAIPMTCNTDQGTPRFQNWESSLYCRFIPYDSKFFFEFCLKFQEDLKNTGYTLSITTFGSFLAMRRQVHRWYFKKQIFKSSKIRNFIQINNYFRFSSSTKNSQSHTRTRNGLGSQTENGWSTWKHSAETSSSQIAGSETCRLSNTMPHEQL